MNNRFVLLLLFFCLASIAAAQNVGIGTSSPGTKLDINGGVTYRETSVSIWANAATIPSNVSQVRLTGAATATITLTAPSAPPNAGQQLVIYNNTTGGYGASYGSTTIPDGVAISFIYSNATWVASSDASSGSSSYIQNQATQQASSNFNISGSGEIGTTAIIGTGEAGSSPTGGILRGPNAGAGANTPGGALNINGGYAYGSGLGGTVTIAGGTTSTGGTEGPVNIRGGYNSGIGEGNVNINDDHGGNTYINTAGGTTYEGGTLVIGTGDGTTTPTGTLLRAPNNSGGGAGGTLNLAGGNGYGTGGNGGSVIITGGANGSSGYNGNLYFRAGSSSVTNSAGNVYINDASNASGVYGGTAINPNGGTVTIGNQTGIPYLTGGVLSIASAGTNYQSPITAGSGLYYSAANTLASYWTASGNNIYNNNNSGAGFVGIGTNGNPASILHVKTSGATFATIDGGSGSQEGFNFYVNGSGVSNLYFDPSTTWGSHGGLMINNYGTNTPNVVVNTAGGNMGINTSGVPAQALSVGGTTGNFLVTSAGAVSTSNTTAATSTTTGALTVTGGAGIGGAVFVGSGLVMGTGDGTSPSGNTSSTFNTIRAVNAGSSSTGGGNLALNAGYGYSAGTGGSVYINGGTTGTGTNGSVTINPGNTTGTGVTAGTVTINSTASGSSSSSYGYTLLNPNGGRVGIGTSAPAAPVEIYQNATDILKLTSSASGSGNHSYIDFSTYGSTTAVVARMGAIDMGGYNGSLVFETNNSGVAAGATTTEKMRITNTGYVGIGTTTPACPLEVEATNNAGYGTATGTYTGGAPTTTHGYLYDGSTPAGYNSVAYPTGSLIAIYTTGRIFCSELDAISDRRVKKDFTLTDSKEDIERLSKIEVTNFRYKDEIANGSNFKKGFIAQQVETVYPEAVTRQSGFIPDIYALSDAAHYDSAAHRLTISIGADHRLAVGDKVRLIAGQTRKDVTVSAVHTDCSFTVADWTVPVSQVFVYGREVPDFRAVDYDRIYTLNVSATQELARQLALEKQELADEKAKNKALEQKVSAFEHDTNADMDKMKASIETMQQIICSKAEK